jgi:hypothetical protein
MYIHNILTLDVYLLLEKMLRDKILVLLNVLAKSNKNIQHDFEFIIYYLYYFCK